MKKVFLVLCSLFMLINFSQVFSDSEADDVYDDYSKEPAEVVDIAEAYKNCTSESCSLSEEEIDGYEKAVAFSEDVEGSLTDEQLDDLNHSMNFEENYNVCASGSGECQLSEVELDAFEQALGYANPKPKADDAEGTEFDKVLAALEKEELIREVEESETKTVEETEADMACGAVMCLTQLEFGGECDKHIDKYFEVREYHHKKFSAVKTVKARMEWLGKCEGASKKKKLAVNVLYGFLYKKP